MYTWIILLKLSFSIFFNCDLRFNVETLISSDIDSLLPHDVKGNCKKAFDAGEALGIPRVIEPADMDILTVPDKLAVMTYLYQLRAHFTGHELEVAFIILTFQHRRFTPCNTYVSLHRYIRSAKPQTSRLIWSVVSIRTIIQM